VGRTAGDAWGQTHGHYSQPAPMIPLALASVYRCIGGGSLPLPSYARLRKPTGATCG
jgi:hypothetical protein